MAEVLSGKRLQILDFIAERLREQGYPPTTREIGEAVGLNSSATVHTHLAVLQREGYLVKDPTKPRAIQVRFDPSSRAAVGVSPVRHVPLVGDVAAGTGVLAQEQVEELLPLPEQFTGTGSTFMLRVRGDSMIELGIFDGDYVVVRQQPDAQPGEVVVAGLPDGDATVKTFTRQGDRVVLLPANPAFSPIELDADQVVIYGRVVTVQHGPDGIIKTEQDVVTGYSSTVSDAPVQQTETVYAHVGMSLRLVDAHSGEVLWSASASGTGQHLNDATEAASAQIMRAVTAKLKDGGK